MSIHSAACRPVPVVTLLALLALAAAGPATAEPAGPRALPVEGDAAVLAAARDRSDQAAAALVALQRAARTGRIAGAFASPAGLDEIDARYGDLQRRVASYRAKLGDRHPTLVAAQLALSDLRAERDAGVARALAAAERADRAARADLAAVERRLGTADLTALGDLRLVAEPLPSRPPERVAVPGARRSGVSADGATFPPPFPAVAAPGAVPGEAAGGFPILWALLGCRALRRWQARPNPPGIEPLDPAAGPRALPAARPWPSLATSPRSPRLVAAASLRAMPSHRRDALPALDA